MEILHLKIVQQSRQVFITGSDAVKFTRRPLFNLIIVVIYVFKDISFTNFVFPLFEWLSVLVTTKVLVRMHRIHVKKDPSKPYMGAFLWEDPDPDFWSVAFLSNKSFFRSVICRIHSGQGFIGSLIWVIWTRIIGSMIQRVSLGNGSEINECAQRFWPWIT